MRKASLIGTAAMAVVLFTSPGAAAEPGVDRREAKKLPAHQRSKKDLAASYSPTRIHGVDWYARVGAARLKNERIQKAGGAERLIFQMRALGPLSGST